MLTTRPTRRSYIYIKIGVKCWNKLALAQENVFCLQNTGDCSFYKPTTLRNVNRIESERSGLRRRADRPFSDWGLPRLNRVAKLILLPRSMVETNEGNAHCPNNRSGMRSQHWWCFVMHLFHPTANSTFFYFFTDIIISKGLSFRGFFSGRKISWAQVLWEEL